MKTNTTIQLDTRKLLGFKQGADISQRSPKVGNVKVGNVKVGNVKVGNVKV